MYKRQALICYADGTKSYILAPAGLTDGMKIMSGENAEARIGNCLPLGQIPVGTQVQMCIRDRFSALQFKVMNGGTSE